MQFFELRRLGVKESERILGGNVVDSGSEVIPENAGEDERLDERRMDDRPDDDTADRREYDGNGDRILKDRGQPVGI